MNIKIALRGVLRPAVPCRLRHGRRRGSATSPNRNVDLDRGAMEEGATRHGRAGTIVDVAAPTRFETSWPR
jgi:hypothetical protein